MRSMWMSALALFLCVALVSCSVNPPPMIVASEQTDYIKGWTQGLMDAQPNTAWAAAGVGAECLGSEQPIYGTTNPQW